MLYMHFYCFFFFNDTATTEIYTLSLHDALPIYSQEDDAPSGSMTASCSTSGSGRRNTCSSDRARRFTRTSLYSHRVPGGDRKSTRLNSSHDQISYAVFCLKKKK